VLSTLKYFRNEYIEHIAEKRCRAGVCNIEARVEVTA
jgi:NADH-quinone oxidoreductase subunit F